VARLLFVGGGCRGQRLAATLVADGHAVRITTRSEAGRAAIESAGAECLIATPDRLGTLRPALETVTIACWLLATARGPREQVHSLHGSRLELFLHQLIDTTVRGFVYEAPALAPIAHAARAEVAGGGPDVVPASPAGAIVAPATLAEGRQIVHTLARRNAIPLSVLAADPGDLDGWLRDARAAVRTLLGARGPLF
jgi:hypothetical protein